MKRLIIVLLLLSFLAARAQKEQHFETPSSPAFTILEFEPVSVLRPTSPSEVKANVLSFFDKDGKMVPNMGIEISPYWLRSNPQLTKDQYLEPNPIQSIIQTFSLSFATVKDSASGPDKLGIGFKLQPIAGKTILDKSATESLGRILDIIGLTAGIRGQVQDENITTLEEAINELTALIKTKYGSSVSSFYNQQFIKIAEKYLDNKQAIIAFLEDVNKEFEDQTLRIEVPRVRKGLLWEVAGATAFPNESADEETVWRYGIWTTLSFKKKPGEDFLFTLRFLQSSADTIRTSIDAGLSYVKDFTKFNISIEGVLRKVNVEFDDFNASNEAIRIIERNTTYRLSVTGQYKVNPFIVFNISIGKNYAQPWQTEGQFFSTAGLSLNLFRPLGVAEGSTL